MTQHVNPNLQFLRDHWDIRHTDGPNKGKRKYRVFVLQGGTRSGKTWATLMFLIELAYAFRGSKMMNTITRETFASLQGTAMRDWRTILESYEYYDINAYNGQTKIHTLYGNHFEFGGIRDSQKLRGGKRDTLYMNEANENTYDAFLQMLLRTAAFAIIDYNPSMYDHWIYDHVLTRDDAIMLVTTYKDNPHVSPDIIQEIELLRETDPTNYSIFGLGERTIPTEIIYPVWKEYTHDVSGEYAYGLDFGYNHPMALVKSTAIENDLFNEQIIYETGMTTPELIKRMDELNVSKTKPIQADHRPDLIEEIHRAGYNIHAADKSVLTGIDKVKSMRIHIHKDSFGLKKEIRSYRWKVDRNGRRIDEPVKFMDDGMDAMRYAASVLVRKKIFEPAKVWTT